MSEQARKVENKAIPEWAQGLYYNSADLAIKCATHSGSNVGRKIWGRVCPRPIPLGFHAFHKPDFPPSQIRLCVAGFMTRFAAKGPNVTLLEDARILPSLLL